MTISQSLLGQTENTLVYLYTMAGRAAILYLSVLEIAAGDQLVALQCVRVATLLVESNCRQDYMVFYVLALTADI